MRHVLGWAAFEAYVNGKLGLEATLASGSQDHDKGDGVDRSHPDETDYALQIDAKYTVKASFAVNRRFMDQCWERARLSGKRFALPIRFADERKGQVSDYIVVPFDDYTELLNAYREQEIVDQEALPLDLPEPPAP